MNCSATTGEIVFAGLMPHAPVLIPGIGCGRERNAAATVTAMQALAARLTASEPGLLILISPHSPRRPSGFGIWQTERIAGDFTQFQAPHIGVNLPTDQQLNRQLAATAREHRLEMWGITRFALDHGAGVPLWFLRETGWTGKTAVIGLNQPDQGGHEALGGAIREAVARTGRRAAIIASGDMSHALQAGGPAGFHPLAAAFDRDVVAAICSGDYRRLQDIDPELQNAAAEDVLDSTLIAAAAVNWNSEGREFLSYEAPFGVGYAVALLHQRSTHERAPARSLDSAASGA